MRYPHRPDRSGRPGSRRCKPRIVVRMGFTQHLRARGEAGLAALLDARGELAAPPPSSVRALAARAAGRASVERTIAALDALALQCLEAVLALSGTAAHRDGPTAAAVAEALGTDEGTVRPALERLLDRVLIWTETWPVADDAAMLPAPGVEDILGPYPAGLGPTLATTLHRRTPQALERLAEETAAPVARTPDGAPVDLAGALAAHLADPGTIAHLLQQGPAAARRVLDALTWGPPVGQAPQGTPEAPSPARAAVQWLLRHGLLAMSDAQHAILPREVGLALRHGRTHAAPALRPEPVPARPDRETADADGARHAEDAVRLVTALLSVWSDQPAPQVRSGGLGLRELRRLAARLEVPESTAALVVELAGAAGLVADDGESPACLVPTTDADDWLADPVPARWQTIATAWLHCDRATWLVGTRDDGGTTRAALDPELRRPWIPRLRSAALATLASPADPPAALSAEQVLDVLRWTTPRNPPMPHAVDAVLTEATLLGALGAGALSTAGRALLEGADAATALQDQLPGTVDELLLQGDLTGIVPGRPGADLALLLDSAAQVESRGAALAVRFTEASVRRALDAGLAGEDLLARLSRFARSGVPQPLEYLVLDVARRHGQLRVGAAASFVRADDPALLAGLLGDRDLAGLGLFALAPTVLAAQAPPATLLAALRDRGLGPVTEGPDGQVLVAARPAHRVRPRRSRRVDPVPDADAAAARERRLQRLATDLFSADRRARHTADDDALPTDDPSAPALALGLLREAAEEHRPVWLQLVGPDGTTSRRRVRPLRVDAGRVRVLDLDREAELTVAVHRIVDVTP